MTPSNASSGLQTTRWRATIMVDFDTRDYPVSESDTAEIQASWFKRSTERCEREVNCGRADVRLVRVDRVTTARAGSHPNDVLWLIAFNAARDIDDEPVALADRVLAEYKDYLAPADPLPGIQGREES